MTTRLVGHSRARAFSLIEVLTSVAILLLLMGIVIPVLTSAKKRAKGANDLAQMKQLGVAATLYKDEHGTMPTGCPTLVQAKLVSSNLCSCLLDASSKGLANDFVASHVGANNDYERLITPFKNSFLGVREWGITEQSLQNKLATGQAKGWLVDLNSASPSEPYGVFWRGSYRRLLDDGAVVNRTVRLYKNNKTREENFYMETLFADFLEEPKK